jgi:multiple sugar transport system substrate-binding protein
MKRYILVGVVIGLLCVSLIGAAEQIVLHIAAFKSPGSEATKKLVSEYLALNPKVKDIVIDEYPYADLRSKILTDFIGKTGAYDIVTGDCIWLAEFVAGKHLRPLEPYFADPTLWKELGMTPEEYDLDDFVPAVLNYLGRYPTLSPTYVGMEHQKQFPLYAIPWLTNTETFLYRRDLYEKYVAPLGIPRPGDTPETAWTFDEFITAAKALTGKPDSPWGMSLQAKRGNSLVWEISNLLGVFGASYFDEKWHPTINTPEWHKLLETYISFYKVYKVAPPEVLGWEHAEEAGALAGGYCAMDLTWNNELNMWIMDPAYSQYWDKWEVAWMVLTEKGKPPYPPSVQGGYFLAIPVYTSEERAREAFKFIIWLTSKPIHKKYVLMGPTPARMSTMEDPDVLAKWPWIKLYSKVIQTPFTRPNCPEWSMIEYNVAITISKVLTGEWTIDYALADLQDRLYYLMERAGYYK